ncbi:colicin D domain-containing protein [Nocardia brasiliensis]|uniref:Putative colicin activity protein n=1 Tax=Nocardia brasiliensis (strain ATCC 700358 / HUJEG-1) TaxID=1133849 RepID=K0ESY2_NOCB7|nr:colicin D domain-containing protein [Nocardia brasiliensis]AFU02903.1 putative colicin activity protein [Nocardia brasiliensis ATCC 700358]
MPGAGNDLLSQLDRAARLHEQGVLSDQQFAELKQQLLGATSTPPSTPSPPPARTESAPPATSSTGGSDPRIPALLVLGLAGFVSGGLRLRQVRDGPAPAQAPDTGDGSGTSYELNDGTIVEFDPSGRFVTPSWVEGGMDTATSVHIFPKPEVTADNPSLRERGLPATIEGGITLPSSPNDTMYLSRVPGPEGDNHHWYIAYTFLDPRLDDPASSTKPGWVPYALIVEDQNGYHQVTDPPAKGSAAATAMAAGLAMWGFQRQPPGQGSRGPGGTIKYTDPVPFKAEPRQLQKKYKHAGDFGVNKPWGKAGEAEYKDALQKHIDNPDTKHIQGTYRGDPAILNYNPNTGLVVVQSPTGGFVTGWKVNSEQAENILQRGSLGGG